VLNLNLKPSMVCDAIASGMGIGLLFWSISELYHFSKSNGRRRTAEAKEA
jgi:choline-glycine betaine transporter